MSMQNRVILKALLKLKYIFYAIILIFFSVTMYRANSCVEVSFDEVHWQLRKFSI